MKNQQRKRILALLMASVMLWGSSPASAASPGSPDAAAVREEGTPAQETSALQAEAPGIVDLRAEEDALGTKIFWSCQDSSLQYILSVSGGQTLRLGAGDVSWENGQASYLIPGLRKAAKLTLTAENSAGYEVDTQTIYIGEDTQPPETPEYFHIRQKDGKRLRLAWEPSADHQSGLSHYLLEYWNTASGANGEKTQLELSASATSYTILLPDDPCSMEVRLTAVDFFAHRAEPAELRYSTAAPTNFRIREHSTADITLAWDAADDVTPLDHYEIRNAYENQGLPLTVEKTADSVCITDQELELHQIYTPALYVVTKTGETVAKTELVVDSYPLLVSLHEKYNESTNEPSRVIDLNQTPNPSYPLSLTMEASDPEYSFSIKSAVLEQETPSGADGSSSWIEVKTLQIAGDGKTISDSIDLTGMDVGTYRYQIRVTDDRNVEHNANRYTVSLVRDDGDAPVIADLNLSSRNGKDGDAQLFISADIRDQGSIEEVQISYAPEGTQDFVELPGSCMPSLTSMFRGTATLKWQELGLVGTYQIKAVAVDGGGRCSEARIETILLSDERPAAPAEFKASRIVDNSSTHVLLSWSAVDGAASYWIYGKNSADGAFRWKNTTEDTTLVLTTDGPFFGYYVTAVNALGIESRPSSIRVPEEVRDTNPPSAPSNFRVTRRSTAGIELSWDAAEDDYGVNRYCVVRPESPNEGTTYHTGGLSISIDQEHLWQFDHIAVMAEDYAGNMSTPQLLKEPHDQIAVTSEPSQYRRVLTGAQDVPLSFTISCSAPGFSIQRAELVKDAGGYTETMISDFAVEGNTIRGNLPAESLNEDCNSFAVRFWEVGHIVHEIPVMIRVIADTGAAPAAPSLTYGPDRQLSSVRISAGGDGEDAVDHYRFFYAPEGSADFTEIPAESPGSSVAYWDWRSLHLTGSYQLKVVAVDGAGRESQPFVRQILLTEEKPAPPQLEDVTQSWSSLHKIDVAEFSWTPQYGIDYRLYTAYPHDPMTFTPAVTIAQGTYGDTVGLIEDGLYRFYITAVDALGNESAPSNILQHIYHRYASEDRFSFVTPTDYQTASGRVPVSLNAQNDMGLTKVLLQYEDAQGTVHDITELYAPKGSKTCEFTYSWNVSQLTPGEYSLVATLYRDDLILDIVKRSVNVLQEEHITPMLMFQQETGTIYWTSAGGGVSCYELYRNGQFYRSVSSETFEVALPQQTGTEGSYTVKARHFDGTFSESDPIDVSAIPDVEAPAAVLTPESVTVPSGTAVTFSGAGSTDNVGISEYRWTFPGGATAKGITASHQFVNEGSTDAVETVTLQVLDPEGHTGTASATVTVQPAQSGETAKPIALAVQISAKDGTPVPNAAVTLTASPSASGGAGSASGNVLAAISDSEGRAMLWPEVLGAYTVSFAAEGYAPQSRAVELREASSTLEILLNPAGATTGTSTSKKDEVQQTTTVETPLTLELGSAAKAITVKAVFADDGRFLPEKSENCGWIAFNGEQNGVTDSDIRVGVFPLSPDFILLVYGETHWLSEFFRVELISLNRDLTHASAVLQLPNGLSLPALPTGGQTESVTLGAQNPVWYVRSDSAGEFRMQVEISALKGETPIFLREGMRSPLTVLEGSALELQVEAPDLLVKGKPYTVEFRLKNNSPWPIADLSFGIAGAARFTVSSNQTEVRQDDLTGGKTISIPTLQPGKTITLLFTTEEWFASSEELGPQDITALLRSVVLTTVSGSSAQIPYDIQMTHVPRSTLVDAQESNAEPSDGKVTQVLQSAVSNSVHMAPSGVKVYQFTAPKTAAVSREAKLLTITIHSGAAFLPYGGNTFDPGAPALMAADASTPVVIYTDAPADRCIIADNTMTIAGDAKVYVQGSGSAGSAEVEMTTQIGSEKFTNTMNYSTGGAETGLKSITLSNPGDGFLPFPGTTNTLELKPRLLAEDGSFLSSDAYPLEWTVLDQKGEAAEHLSVVDGKLVITENAVPGIYKLRASCRENGSTVTSNEQNIVISVQNDGWDKRFNTNIETQGNHSVFTVSTSMEKEVSVTLVLTAYDSHGRMLETVVQTGKISAAHPFSVQLTHSQKAENIKGFLLDHHQAPIVSSAQ